jgi:hypothetical protein
VEPSPLLLRLFIGLLYQSWMIDGDDCGVISHMNEWQGNRNTWRKPAPAPFCPPQVPYDDLGSNPGLHGGKPVTNWLRYSMASMGLVTRF